MTYPFDRRAKIALIVLCVTLLASGVGFKAAVNLLNVQLEKLPVDLRESFSNIPQQLGEWKAVGRDAILDAAIVESLGTTDYLQRTYEKTFPNGEIHRVNVHLAYYTGMIDAVPHVPDRCFVAGGMEQRTLPENVALSVGADRWPRDPGVLTPEGDPYPTVLSADRVTRRPREIHMPLGEFEIRVTEFAVSEAPEYRIFGGYYFIANGRTTARPAGIKRLAFSPTEKHAYYCKVQLTAQGDADYDQERYVEIASDISEALLPELMWCLPDWPTVQSLNNGA